MAGIFSMRALGLVKLHVKPTRYASNIVGGLLPDLLRLRLPVFLIVFVPLLGATLVLLEVAK